MQTDDRPDGAIPNWFLFLVAGAIIVTGLWVGRTFLTPLAITALVFILSTALVDWLCSRTSFGFAPPRWLANLIVASGTIVFLFVLGNVLSEAAQNFIDTGPKLGERVGKLFGNIESLIGSRAADAIRNTVANLDFGDWVGAALGQLAGGVSSLMLVALYLVFLMSERMAWIEKLALASSSPAQAERNRAMLHRISTGVQQYMLVNALTSALSGAVAYLIFRFVGLEFAELLAVIVFVVGFIPNIGAFVGIALPSLVALVQFDTFTPFLIVLLGYGLFDQFVGNILQPAMQSRSLNVSTFVVMISLAFWGALWGGLGVFLAVPLTVVLMVICAEIPSLRWVAILLSGDGVIDREVSS